MKALYFVIACILLLAGGLTITAVAQATNTPTAPQTTAAEGIVISGFDAARGAYASIPDGAAFAEARQAITTTFPSVTFTSFPTITQSALANTDILILTPVNDGANPITPLSPAEQTALTDFVTGGGCAILLADNADFASANTSLLAPFGMEIAGMLWGWSTVTVANPAATLLTSGFHGQVASFTQGWPGGLTNLGPYATSYAANALGDAIAIIEPDAIASGSGAVIIYADATTFFDADDGGDFAGNKTLFLNSISFCQHQDLFLPVIVKGTP